MLDTFANIIFYNTEKISSHVKSITKLFNNDQNTYNIFLNSTGTLVRLTNRQKKALGSKILFLIPFKM